MARFWRQAGGGQRPFAAPSAVDGLSRSRLKAEVSWTSSWVFLQLLTLLAA